MSNRGRGDRSTGVAERYVVFCPDVLDVEIAGRPELSGSHTIGVDGKIDLEPLGRPSVEGQTPEEIALEVADVAHVPAAQVHVEVMEYGSQYLLLFGEVNGSQRAVAYVGQETVLDLLQRTGGLTPGAASDNVFVVRPHVVDGQRPEVFHVDLRAIVLRHDERSNLRLQPYDQVHVGQTRRARLQSCVPQWLQPLYERLCSWLPTVAPQEIPPPKPAGERAASTP